MKPLISSKSSIINKSDIKKFIIYSLYSWGTPLALFTVGYIVDESKQCYSFKPKFRGSMCFMNSEYNINYINRYKYKK